MWISLKQRSKYSLLSALGSPEQIVAKHASHDRPAVALTEYYNIASSMQLSKAAKSHKVKPILGLEINVTDCGTITLLARDKTGWTTLLHMVSCSNKLAGHNAHPTVTMGELEALNGPKRLIALTGYVGSTLKGPLFSSCIEKHIDIFGKENLFLCSQLNDTLVIPEQVELTGMVRDLAKKHGLKVVAISDSHYINKQDVEDQRVLLCSHYKTTLNKVLDDVFFKSDKFYIPSDKELLEWGHTEEELKNTELVAEMCENYSILKHPKPPKFQNDKGLDSDEYLRLLCKEGWMRKIRGRVSPEQEKVYGDRMKYELDVFKKSGLSDYFLIVQDYVNWAKRQGMLVGVSRGSAGGCLTSYLTNIIELDPIPYNLVFERFYNAGRNTAEKVSLPDIDVDFPKLRRDEVVEYIRNKYGRDKVARISTFSRLQGKGALKEVLRIHNVCDYSEMNKITESIPDEAAIADKLEEMRDAGENPSIIQWSLEHEAKELSEWASLENGEIVGPLAEFFKQAIRIEGSYKSVGIHAAGLVISQEPLRDICPLVPNKEGNELVIGFDMQDAELAGLMKADILVTAVLDKLSFVNELLARKDNVCQKGNQLSHC